MVSLKIIMDYLNFNYKNHLFQTSFQVNNTSNRLNTRRPKFLFNELFGLINSITGSNPIGGGSFDDDDDDDDDAKLKNCTCGKFSFLLSEDLQSCHTGWHNSFGVRTPTFFFISDLMQKPIHLKVCKRNLFNGSVLYIFGETSQQRNIDLKSLNNAKTNKF